MARTSKYAFSKTRLVIYVVLLLITAGAFLPFGLLWELYRYSKHN